MDNQDLRLPTTDAGGDRPRIAASGSASFISSLIEQVLGINCVMKKRKYKPGDVVYLNEAVSRSLAGLFLISSVISEGKYILYLENGDKAKDGKEFEEKDLDKA